MEVISRSFDSLMKSADSSDETLLDLIKTNVECVRNFTLNQRKALEKLAENTKLCNYDIKTQNSCTTIQMNSGIYILAIMRIAKSIKEGDTIEYGENRAVCSKAEQRYDNNGSLIESFLTFRIHKMIRSLIAFYISIIQRRKFLSKEMEPRL